MINLSIGILAIEARRHLVENLARKLYPYTVDALFSKVDKIPKNPRNMLLKKTSRDTTHRLILEDDAILCDNFISGALKCIEARPENIIPFFYPRKDAIQAHHSNIKWMKIYSSTSVATVYPTQIINEFLEWQDNYIKEDYPSMDWTLSAFMYFNNHVAYAPIPSLVDHNSYNTPSTLGHSNTHSFAHVFADNINADVTKIDWSDLTYRTSSMRNLEAKPETMFNEEGLRRYESLCQK